MASQISSSASHYSLTNVDKGKYFSSAPLLPRPKKICRRKRAVSDISLLNNISAGQGSLITTSAPIPMISTPYGKMKKVDSSINNADKLSSSVKPMLPLRNLSMVQSGVIKDEALQVKTSYGSSEKPISLSNIGLVQTDDVRAEVLQGKTSQVQVRGSLSEEWPLRSFNSLTHALEQMKLKSLYLQEGTTIETTSTALETLHEGRDLTRGHKYQRLTVFSPYPSSKQKLKHRRNRAKVLRKQGVRVPSGNMFTYLDVKLALAHIDNNEDAL